MNETQINQKSFSDSDICRNEERGNSASQKTEMAKITGKLTSRIETRQKAGETYHYGFFELIPPECDGCDLPRQEIPVVFKTKPALTKGSQVQLTGNWAKSNGNRPSFTCQAYQITSDPPIKINCFYNRPYSPCSFTTHESQLMEKHYRKEHYPQAKEVSRV